MDTVRFLVLFSLFSKMVLEIMWTDSGSSLDCSCDASGEERYYHGCIWAILIGLVSGIGVKCSEMIGMLTSFIASNLALQKCGE